MADMSIQNEMRVLDTRDTTWYPSLNEDELKKLSIFVLQRWMSALQSSDVSLQEHYLEYVNEFSNSFILFKRYIIIIYTEWF